MYNKYVVHTLKCLRIKIKQEIEMKTQEELKEMYDKYSEINGVEYYENAGWNIEDDTTYFRENNKVYSICRPFLCGNDITIEELKEEDVENKIDEIEFEINNYKKLLKFLKEV